MAQLSACTQKRTETCTELGQAVRKLTKPAYPKAGNQIQDRLAKERFLEVICYPHVHGKMRDLRPATLKDAMDKACMLRDKEDLSPKGPGCPGLGQPTPQPTPPLNPAPAPESKVQKALKEIVNQLKPFSVTPAYNTATLTETGIPYILSNPGGIWCVAKRSHIKGLNRQEPVEQPTPSEWPAITPSSYQHLTRHTRQSHPEHSMDPAQNKGTWPPTNNHPSRDAAPQPATCTHQTSNCQ